MTKTHRAVAVLLAPALLAAPAFAQDGGAQVEEETATVTLQAPPAPLPEGKPAPLPIPEDLKPYYDLLLGRFADGHNSLRIVETSCPGAPGVLFGEFVAGDGENQNTAHVLFQFLHRRGNLYLRMFRLPGGGMFAPGVACVPTAIPVIELDQLDVVADLPVRIEGPAASPTQIIAKADGPFPTVAGGAVEMMSEIRVTKETLTLREAGMDSEGRQVWAFPSSGEAVFKRTGSVDEPVETRVSGLKIEVMKPASDPKAAVGQPGDEFTVHYTGWLPIGRVFDSSRGTGREPFTTRIPASLIQGWNEGLLGMKVGETRRLIIPPSLGYGVQGYANVIPPSSWLVFEVELVNLNKAPAKTEEAQPDADQPEKALPDQR
ncbi:MAG: FKBP-type peptidyl-prolyl cis-trans isomerase [Phycisphaerales bacterium]